MKLGWKFSVFFSGNKGFHLYVFTDPNNPTKNLQEAFSDWYLNYRSSEELMRIAGKADIKEGDVTIEQEPLGINLFMRIKIKKDIQVKTNTKIPDFEKYSEN